MDGWKWREDRQWERAAWMVAYLLQPWSKRPIRPAELLGHDAPEQPTTFKEWVDMMPVKPEAPDGDR